tara:strand:- start:181 stop:492 length:312 start_codon:yes stop_codon:yes gene_type:complete
MKKGNNMYKYIVNLKHVPNPDINNGKGNGYWGLPTDKKDITIKTNTLREVQDKFYDWKCRNDLGGGNIPYIYIRDTENKKIAHISANCRIWDMDNNEIITELR